VRLTLEQATTKMNSLPTEEFVYDENLRLHGRCCFRADVHDHDARIWRAYTVEPSGWDLEVQNHLHKQYYHFFGWKVMIWRKASDFVTMTFDVPNGTQFYIQVETMLKDLSGACIHQMAHELTITEFELQLGCAKGKRDHGYLCKHCGKYFMYDNKDGDDEP
jgi:hypothetical protein